MVEAINLDRTTRAEFEAFCEAVASRLDPILLGRGFYPPQCIPARDSDGSLIYAVLYETYGDALAICWPEFCERASIDRGGPINGGLELWVEKPQHHGRTRCRLAGWTTEELIRLYDLTLPDRGSNSPESDIETFAYILGVIWSYQPRRC